MKKLFFFLFLSVSIFISTVKAQTARIPNSLLWKVTGNGLITPSYLAGTYHMMCAEDFLIKDKVKEALQKSARLVLEVNFMDSSENAALLRMMQSDRTLSSQLNEIQSKRLDSILQTYGTSLTKVDRYSLAALYSLLATKAIPCPQSELKMYDIELMKIAFQAGKNISGLEKLADQQAFIQKAFTLEELIDALAKGEDYSGTLKEMLNAFKTENLEALDRHVKDRRYMTAAQEAVLLTDRNHQWVKAMPEIMKDGSAMFAVGSGHLSGKDGVITLLRKQGYTVEPIMQ